VRCFLTIPEGVPVEVEEEFVATFTPREQLYVKTSMKGMFFFNLLFSTISQGELGTRVVSWIVAPMLFISDRRQRSSRMETTEPASQIDDYPEDLKYHKEHMWVRSDGTIGISFFAQDQLGEIVFIEVPEAGADVEAGEAFGEVESRKSVSDLYAPISGTLKEVNSEVLDTPETINEEPYGKGWVGIVEMSDPGEMDNLLSAAEYKELVSGGQRPADSTSC
jgi:glycine cleavage system H protein